MLCAICDNTNDTMRLCAMCRATNPGWCDDDWMPVYDDVVPLTRAVPDTKHRAMSALQARIIGMVLGYKIETYQRYAYGRNVTDTPRPNGTRTRRRRYRSFAEIARDAGCDEAYVRKVIKMVLGD